MQEMIDNDRSKKTLFRVIFFSIILIVMIMAYIFFSNTEIFLKFYLGKENKKLVTMLNDFNNTETLDKDFVFNSDVECSIDMKNSITEESIDEANEQSSNFKMNVAVNQTKANEGTIIQIGKDEKKYDFWLRKGMLLFDSAAEEKYVKINDKLIAVNKYDNETVANVIKLYENFFNEFKNELIYSDFYKIAEKDGNSKMGISLKGERLQNILANVFEKMKSNAEFIELYKKIYNAIDANAVLTNETVKENFSSMIESIKNAEELKTIEIDISIIVDGIFNQNIKGGNCIISKNDAVLYEATVSEVDNELNIKLRKEANQLAIIKIVKQNNNIYNCTIKERDTVDGGKYNINIVYGKYINNSDLTIEANIMGYRVSIKNKKQKMLNGNSETNDLTISIKLSDSFNAQLVVKSKITFKGEKVEYIAKDIIPLEEASSGMLELFGMLGNLRGIFM